MKKYDYIIAGSGCAGLSLAYKLSKDPDFNHKNILIIDKDDKNTNDRTWCFWTDKETPYDSIIKYSWSSLAYSSDKKTVVTPLSRFRYKLIRGIDFYNFTLSAIRKRKNFEFIKATVSNINAIQGGAQVVADGKYYEADYVFDACFHLQQVRSLLKPGSYQLQHFMGWEVQFEEKLFDLSTATLMDFRTPQHGNARFVYVLPFATDKALVEYTVFSGHTLAKEDYELALSTYIEKCWPGKKYEILNKEYGVIPMTEQSLSVHQSSRIVPIGTMGGAVKPTTGYAFLRIQKQTDQIVSELKQGLSPLGSLLTKKRYRFYDRLLLNILEFYGDQSKPIFDRLFYNNKMDRILTFLDENASLAQEIRIFLMLPKWPFFRAIWEVYFQDKTKNTKAATIQEVTVKRI
ncbi:MAG: lycopene cyclase family protein [Bacteroidota bacterium]